MEQHHDHHQEEVVTRTASSTGSPAWLLPASILIAAILISGSVLYMAQGSRATLTPEEEVIPTETPVSGDRDAILGDPNAPVTIIAFEDFQCSYCAKYYEDAEAKIREAYVTSGKVKLVYRHLAFLGPESVSAAAASECAKDQGKFWEFHDALFDAQLANAQSAEPIMKRGLYVQIAKDLKLDEAAFASCVDTKKYDAYVQEQTETAGMKYGVNSTPTIFVNDQKIEGAYPFSEFQQAIDGILAAQ